MRKILVIIIALPPLLLGAEWQSLNGPPAGRADDMTIGWDSEYNCWAIFAADNTHNLYKSTDLINPLGEYWDSIYLDPNVVNPACVISRPNDAQIVYIGKNSTTPVWWSEDGGQTWEERSGESPNNITNTSPLCFAINPNDANTIYLGCKSGALAVFKTMDGGETWNEKPLPTSPYANPSVNDIAVKDTTTVLAGCSGSSFNNGIWLSGDGGDNWSRKLASVDILSVEFANETIVYAGSFQDSIYKSTDGGNFWSRLPNSPQVDYVYDIKAINSDTIYATTDKGMFMTTDGGNNWEEINTGICARNLHCSVIYPANSQILFTSGDYSIYKTTNAGDTWSDKVKGYPILPINSMSSENYYLYSIGSVLGKEPVVPISLDDGANWYTSSGFGPPDFAFPLHIEICHDEDSTIAFAGYSQGSQTQQECGPGGRIHRTTNAGYSWSMVYGPPTHSFPHEALSLNCITSNPDSHRFVYAGYDFLAQPDVATQYGFIRSDDYGVNWYAPCSSGLAEDTVFSIAVNPQNGYNIYTGTKSHGVYKSTCNGDTWNKTNLNNVDINALAIDFDYPTTVYAGSKNPNGVYKTIDGGDKWSEVNNGLGSYRYIQDIEIDSEEPTIVYTLCKQNKNANQSYVYCSVDRGSKWFDVSTGLPTDKKIHDLEIDFDEPDPVYAATDNGAYTYTPDFDKSRVSSSHEATSYNNSRKMVQIDSTIWVCYESGGVIYATKSTDLGQTWSKKMELGIGKTPAIARPKDSAVWHPEVGIAWVRHGASKDTVYYRQYSSGNWENPDTVYTTDGTPKALSLTLTNNQVFVIFTETPEAPNGEFVVCTRFIPGQTVTTDTLDSGPGAFYASIDYLKDNATVNAAWAKNNQIYFTYYDGDWDQSIEQVGFSDSTNTQVSIEAINDRAYVVWSAKAPSGGHYNVYWRYKSYNGTPSWSSTYLISRNSTSDCEYPTLTEGIYCSYTQNNEIYSNCFDSIASNWGSAPINVSNTGQRSIYSHITRHQINDDTYIYYLWTEKDSVPYDIKFSSYKIPVPASPDIMANKQSNDAVIAWHPVTTDIYGNPITCDAYTTYRDTSFNFVPGSSNLFASGSDTTVTDTNALLSSDNYNYLTFSHSTYGTQSIKSNMGYKFNKFLNENPDTPTPTSDRNWVSLPWQGEYATCSLLCLDLSPNAEVFNKVTHLVDTTQAYFSWFWHAVLGKWMGINFAILPGHFYEFNAVKDTTLVLVGANYPDSSRFLNENPSTSDRNWVGLPYNAAYSTVSDITDEIALSGSPINKVTHLVDSTQTYFSYFYHAGLGRWLGTNFAIEPGHGYEFVATKDSTWNPTEWSNEEQGLFIVTPPTQKPYINMYVGTSLEPTRVAVWFIDGGSDKKVEKELKKDMDHCCADLYRPVTATSKSTIDHRKNNICISDSDTYTGEGTGEPRGDEDDERNISHLVWTHLKAQGFENVVFTTYRLNDPHDVLTEKSAGSVLASNAGASYHLINNDVGNFKNPWKHGEEVVLIVEATKKGKVYYDVIDYKLDDKVDIQVLRDVEFKPYPKLVSGGIYWKATDSDNIVGYSLYKGDKRLNERVLTQRHYRAEGDVNVKLVIKGGYETVYGSQGIQSIPKESIPISYAFNIRPNPFVKQTRVNYALPNQTSVKIVIYDVSGRKTKILVSEMKHPGYYSEVWDGKDDRGRQVSSGVYFIRLEADEFKTQEKVLLVR